MHFDRPGLRGLAAVLVAGLTLPAHAAEQFGDRVYYFGELHAHTGLSGDGKSSDLGDCENLGCGNFTDFFHAARDVAGLDFAAVTDHINGGSAVGQEGWNSIRELVMDGHAQNEGFVSILGGELDLVLTEDGAIGHKNYLFFGHDPTYAQIPLDDLALASVAEFCDEVWPQFHDLDSQFGPMLLIPHHPAATKPRETDWSCHDEALSPVVEVYSAHGNSRSTPATDTYDPLEYAFCLTCSVNHALAYQGFGLHVGLIGGTDFHDTWPGLICHMDLVKGHPYGGSLTGIVLDEGEPLTRLAIYGALKARRTYATSGPKWPALISVIDAHGNEVGITGDIVSPPPDFPVTVQVSLPPDLSPYVTNVRLYTAEGHTGGLAETSPGIFEFHYGELELPWFAYAIVTIDGGTWYADQVIPCYDGGEDTAEKIWTSPIWIEELDTSDDDGDGLSEADGDCDDGDPDISPDADEVANGVDDDCDGQVDEGTDAFDGDGDGVSPLDGDCDDGNPAVFPGAPPQCDGVPDNDCDGLPDDDERDRDGDGHDLCGHPSGVPDCDDRDATVHPGAPAICDDVWDNDCDGEPDDNERDVDGDWVTECAGDCDDRNPAISPHAAERRNGIDDDCDGEVDEGHSNVLGGACDLGRHPGLPGVALSLTGLLALAFLRRRL